MFRKAPFMVELRSFTLYLTTGSHVVSAEVADRVLRALIGGDDVIAIPVESIIDDDAECELTVSTRHVVGVLVSRPKDVPSASTGAGVAHLRVAART